MTERWWAPAGAHIGPDEIDLANLKSGGDAKLDLGAALLTVHRVGAAACEAVASSPMPDESALINALVTARLAFANPVVDAVSKAVGKETYAGLLVRDVVDDAESAALDLFRAAVSKGVAPPLAAQRVGLVYGVDASALGTYRTLACTPNVNPVALADAADRTLFGHVSKLVEDEAPEQPLEAVVKATPATLERAVAQDDPATDFYDARDTAGRFTSTRTKPNLLQRLREAGKGTAKAPEVAAPRTQRKQRVQRKQRTQRTLRTQPEAAVEATPRTRTRQRERVRSTMTQRERVRLRQEADNTPDRGNIRFAEDMWALPVQVEDTEIFQGRTVVAPLTFYLTNSEWLDLVTKSEGRGLVGPSGEPTDPHRFRMGHLIDGLREGDERVHLAAAPGADQAYAKTVEKTRELNDMNQPVTVEYVDSTPLTSVLELQQHVHQRRKDIATEYVDNVLGGREKDDITRNDDIANEMQRVFDATDRATGKRVLVHIPTRDADGNVIPVRTVNQFWIGENEAEGYIEGAGGPERRAGTRTGAASAEVVLNPNTPYWINTNSDSRSDHTAYEIEYDSNTGMMVHVYYINRYDESEDMGKAATLLDDPATTYYDARATDGRFARAQITAALRPTGVTAPPQRKQRSQRKQRTQRTQRIQPVQQEQQEQVQAPRSRQRQRQRMSQRQRLAFKRGQLKKLNELKQADPVKARAKTLTLSKNREYVVMDPADFRAMLKANRMEPEEFQSRPMDQKAFTLSHKDGVGALLAAIDENKSDSGQDKITGQDAEMLFQMMTETAASEQSFEELDSETFAYDDEDEFQSSIGEYVTELFEDNDHLVEVRWDIEAPKDQGDYMTRTVHFEGNSKAVDAPVLVEWDEEIRHGDDISFVYQGVKRASHIQRDYQAPGEEDLSRNPNLQVFRAVGGYIDTYRAEAEPPEYGE